MVPEPEQRPVIQVRMTGFEAGRRCVARRDGSCSAGTGSAGPLTWPAQALPLRDRRSQLEGHTARDIRLFEALVYVLACRIGRSACPGLRTMTLITQRPSGHSAFVQSRYACQSLYKHAFTQRALFGITGLGACWSSGSGHVCQAWIIGGHPECSVDIAQAQLT